MRILLSCATEFDKCEGLHFARVLRRLGHEVLNVNVAAKAPGGDSPGRVVAGYTGDVSIHDLIIAHGGADVFVYFEPAGLIPLELHCSPIPTACVMSDTHRNIAAHQTVARLFDHVFTYMPNYISAYTEHPEGTVHFLPYACDTTVIRDLGVSRDLDVGFIGRRYTPERQRLLGALAARYKINEDRYYLQDEIASVYSRAKIVVDMPADDYITFRIFEAMTCGALVLVKRVKNGQERLFTEGVHYDAFDSAEELQEKVAFYLSHPVERERIAGAGRAEVLQNHTLDQRCVELIAALAAGPHRTAPIRKVGEDDVWRTYAAINERSGRVETLLKLAASKNAIPSSAVRSLMLAMATKAFLRRAILRW